MADIAICYARDGEATAGWLSGLLRSEGFSIWSEAAARGPIAERVADVRAAIVIWSEGARASEWVKAEANYARGQRKLVQAAVDGEPPPMPFDPGAVAPLDGWMGEENHPGWLRLRKELEGLCRNRAPQPAAERPQAAAAPATATAAAAPPAPPPRAARSGGRGLGRLAAVLLALAVIAGAFVWMRSGAPYGSDAGASASTASPPPAAAEPRPAPPAPVVPVAPAPAQGFAAAAEEQPLAAGETAAEEAEPPAKAERPRARPRPAPRRSGPRINRRNSENMRLFCQRAGRGTPQCRAFQRQMRGQ